MLARRLPGILPEMTQEESLEVTRIYSVAGLLPDHASLIVDRPFRSPHHHISVAGLIGGGSGLARPGEITLANNGVLFLDEFTQFRPEVLESLRGPIEEGRVRISRSGGVVSFPSRFSLIAAMNPCACGYEGDRQRSCTCSAIQLQSYARKLSGPLMDRFDMQTSVPRLSKAELLGEREGEGSRDILNRVIAARQRQAIRFGPGCTNASVDQRILREHVDLRSESIRLLGRSIDSARLSGRGFIRTLRVARTLADLNDSQRVELEHVVKALDFRFLDQRAEVVA